jgi:hypothetical protein
MSTPAEHAHDTSQLRGRQDLGDLLEDFSFAVMLSAGAAIAVTILVRMAILRRHPNATGLLRRSGRERATTRHGRAGISVAGLASADVSVRSPIIEATDAGLWTAPSVADQIMVDQACASICSARQTRGSTDARHPCSRDDTRRDETMSETRSEL